MAVRCIDRLTDTGICIALDRGLHTYMLFRRQVVGGNEVGRRGLVGMLIAPGLQQWMIQDMLTCAVASYHGKVVHGLDTGTDSREETRRTRWCLGQQDSIAYSLLLDFGLCRLWQPLDKLPLHVFVALEVREGAFLSRDIRG